MLASPGQSPGSRHIIISSTQTAITRGPQMSFRPYPEPTPLSSALQIFRTQGYESASRA